ncbi:MAG: hypothetical protein ACO2ZZ_11980 [Cyclobacteriaceae bacterium]|jgi:hypothetical protein
MKLEELERKNEKFRQAAGRIDELLPGENLISLCSLMIRSSKRVDQLLQIILQSSKKVQFYKYMDRMEEELDDIVFGLDELAILNTRKKVPQLEDFIKFGYDLLQVYSLACDSIIAKRTHQEV